MAVLTTLQPFVKLFGFTAILTHVCTATDLLDVRNAQVAGLLNAKDELFLVTKEAVRVYKLVGESSDINAELIGLFRREIDSNRSAELAELRTTGDHSFIYCWQHSCR